MDGSVLHSECGIQRQLRKKEVEKALGKNGLSAYAVRWLDGGCLSILVGSMRQMAEASERGKDWHTVVSANAILSECAPF